MDEHRKQVKVDREGPESLPADWRNDSKLIGYGVFSLVFRPPFAVPNSDLFSVLENAIQKEPDRFVGLVTTYNHYNKKISHSTELLKRLSLKNPNFSRLIAIPCSMNPQKDFVKLDEKLVTQLVERYHAVRKRVEYDGTWKDKHLVQLIYPYAGQPLERFYKNPKMAPAWSDFFRGMADAALFINALHEEGYVHGDLSPNNLLYQQEDHENSKITVVDWNMMSSAENFLEQKKGRSRVGCWSPEHFSLTTTRLDSLEEDGHWLLYAEEMQKYLARLLDFSFSSKSKASAAIREYFESYITEQKHPAFQAMYTDLKIVSSKNPSAIGKYHDLRYFMDTIGKCVSALFPNRTEAQQNQYDFFISLCLVQNLPGRKFYLENPEKLAKRLLLILQACQYAGREPKKMPAAIETEQSLLNLLQ